MLHVVLPYLVPIATVVIGLILAGHDLGTAMVVLVIVAAVLLVAGAPEARLRPRGGSRRRRASRLMVTGSNNRTSRIANWLDPTCNADPDGWCGQSVHGLYALADGGWWGVGLGASQGEVGVALRGAQRLHLRDHRRGARPARHADDPAPLRHPRLGLLPARQPHAGPVRPHRGCGIMAWLLGQAIINIGAVIGLFPVIGVPLPLVSAGGSSLVTTLLALGILLSFARNEPGCKALLDARPSMVRRSLAVLPSRVRSVPQRRRSR